MFASKGSRQKQHIFKQFFISFSQFDQTAVVCFSLSRIVTTNVKPITCHNLIPHTVTTASTSCRVLMSLLLALGGLRRNRGFARQPCCMAGTMKIFCIKKRTFFPIGKLIYCSCHATWLLCKTSILRKT